MMPFRQRDLLLVTIPFSDLTSGKVRPVIVLSNDEYNRHGPDLLVAAVTSNLSPRPYTVPLDAAQLEDGALRHPSMVRVDKLFSVDQGIIRGRFGSIRSEVLGQIRGQLESLLGERHAQVGAMQCRGAAQFSENPHLWQNSTRRVRPAESATAVVACVRGASRFRQARDSPERINALSAGVLGYPVA